MHNRADRFAFATKEPASLDGPSYGTGNVPKVDAGQRQGLEGERRPGRKARGAPPAGGFQCNAESDTGSS
ncbi:hypothetical protein BH20ACT24_BH20ACT24_20940 [soil metagenome]